MNRRSFLGYLAGAGAYLVGLIATRPFRALTASAPDDTTLTGFYPGGFTVPEGHTWRIAGLVETDGNVVVNGTLQMRAGDTLRFLNVNEQGFQGGGLVPLASDVGLWVMQHGNLDLQGTPKQGWSRTGDGTGWTDQDELLLVPYQEEDYTTYTPWTRGQLPPQVDPRLPRAEVLNLTRDCVIEGTPTGRSHVFIHAHHPQTIKYVTFKNMGPQKTEDGEQVVVTGRWPLHFHHMDEDASGSLVEGCLVLDSGSHAFVSHRANGVTFRDCVAHNIQSDAYWWDNTSSSNDVLPEDAVSNAVVYEGCVASKVQPLDSENTRIGGFVIQRGEGNVVRNCVAVGVVGQGVGDGGANQQDATAAGGFSWRTGNTGDWEFNDNLAHNLPGAGIFGWWNDQEIRPPIRGFTAYHVGAGVFWGAYLNRQDMDQLFIYRPAVVGVALQAISGLSGTNPLDEITISNVTCEGGRFGITVPSDNKQGMSAPATIRDSSFTGWSERGVMVYASNNNPYKLKLRNVFLGLPETRHYWFEDNADDNVLIDTGSFDFRSKTAAGGTPKPEWNAVIT